MRDVWERWTLRGALLPSIVWLYLAATQWRVAGHFPSAAVLLYCGWFTLKAALVLAVPMLAMAYAERVRGAWLGEGLAVIALFAWPVHALSVVLAASDGLRARGYSAPLLEWGFTLLVLAIPLSTWAFLRFAPPRPLPLSLGVLTLLTLLLVDVRVARAWAELASLIELALVLFAAALIELVTRPYLRQRSKLRVGLLSMPLVLLPCLLAQPAEIEEGRRQALLEESSLDYLDGRLRAWGTALETPTPEACGALREEGAGLPPVLGPAARNVVLISIDSVRADYPRRRWQGRALMPEVERFMLESERAADAYAAYPATALSLSAAFTGLLPSEIVLSPQTPRTLFSRAKGLVQRAQAVLPRGQYFQRRDVQHYLLRDLPVDPQPGARAQTDAAITQLRAFRQRQESHLLWVHYFEPHEPYDERPELGHGSEVRERYAGELAYVDRELGRLLEVLRSEGWYRDSLIILFSDHGESFGEHGHHFHHQLVYPWLTRVPFALHAPGRAPRVITSPVQLTDIAPTVLHFLGESTARTRTTGSSLFAALPARRTLFSEAFTVSGTTLLSYAQQPAPDAAELRRRFERVERGFGYPSKLAVTRDGLQLVLHRGSEVSELYDVAVDRRAANDLFHARADERQALLEAASTWRTQLWMRAACALRAP